MYDTTLFLLQKEYVGMAKGLRTDQNWAVTGLILKMGIDACCFLFAHTHTQKDVLFIYGENFIEVKFLKS